MSNYSPHYSHTHLIHSKQLHLHPLHTLQLSPSIQCSDGHTSNPHTSPPDHHPAVAIGTSPYLDSLQASCASYSCCSCCFRSSITPMPVLYILRAAHCPPDHHPTDYHPAAAYDISYGLMPITPRVPQALLVAAVQSRPYHPSSSQAAACSPWITTQPLPQT